MWGDAIIGFGQYAYTNSKGTNEWLLTGVSPRKRALSVYIMSGFRGEESALLLLGPHRCGASCLYITRLARIDMAVLEGIVSRSVAILRERYPE